MKHLRKALEKLRKIKRESYHHLIHKLHRKHKLHKKTLFYIKEYGKHSNVPKTIIKESIKILLIASIVSSLGGLALEHIKNNLIAIVPLIILLPALNDMIGDYGSIVSGKFSTMLWKGEVKNDVFKTLKLKKLFFQIIIIGLMTAILSSILALFSAHFINSNINSIVILKIFFIVILDTLILVSLLFFTAVFAGLYYFRKKEDPNNFLIPITTAIADFGNMIVLTLLVLLIF